MHTFLQAHSRSAGVPDVLLVDVLALCFGYYVISNSWLSQIFYKLGPTYWSEFTWGAQAIASIARKE